jgi:hypothetical protein
VRQGYATRRGHRVQFKNRGGLCFVLFLTEAFKPLDPHTGSITPSFCQFRIVRVVTVNKSAVSFGVSSPANGLERADRDG